MWMLRIAMEKVFPVSLRLLIQLKKKNKSNKLDFLDTVKIRVREFMEASTTLLEKKEELILC